MNMIFSSTLHRISIKTCPGFFSFESNYCRWPAYLLPKFHTHQHFIPGCISIFVFIIYSAQQDTGEQGLKIWAWEPRIPGFASKLDPSFFYFGWTWWLIINSVSYPRRNWLDSHGVPFSSFALVDYKHSALEILENECKF